jgi:hypothetical protein
VTRPPVLSPSGWPHWRTLTPPWVAVVAPLPGGRGRSIVGIWDRSSSAGHQRNAGRFHDTACWARIRGGRHILVLPSSLDCKQPPGSGDTFQFVFPAVLEVDTGSGDQVNDRARDQYLSGVRHVLHPLSDVDADPPDIRTP